MNRSAGANGFLIAYFFIIIVSILGNFWLYDFSDQQSVAFTWFYSIGQSTLTHFNLDITFSEPPYSFYTFSLIITQSSGLILNTILLWLSWRFFGSDDEKTYPIGKAFRYTFLVSLICESALFGFFLYGIPAELTNYNISEKLLAALTLSINSFNIAGFSLYPNLLGFEVFSSNFMVQVGIIGGAVMGSLSIFVLIELFSPIKLKQRIKDPTIDWSLITKISFFGSAISLLVFVGFYFGIGNLKIIAEKNVLESLAFILMEGIGARGFGIELLPDASPLYESLKVVYSLFTCGPFSIGGSVGLLFFAFLYIGILKKQKTSQVHDIIFSIVRNWLVISVIILGVSLIITVLSENDFSFQEMLYAYSANHMSIRSSETSWIEIIVKSLVNISGRISFIAACLITLKQHKYASGII